MGPLSFILVLILFLLLISIILYTNVRIRRFYMTNSSSGDPLTFTPANNNYYILSVGKDTKSGTGTPLEFIPLYEDRLCTVNGGIVLLVSGTEEEFYQINVLDNDKIISNSVQKIRPGPSYIRMTFNTSKGDERKLRLEARRYDIKLQKFIPDVPSFNIISAWGYYY